MILSLRKKRIEESFGNKVATYNRHAFLQKESAQKLCFLLLENTPLNILEIGCGTGFLTEELQKKYPKSKITAIDISPRMIAACTKKFWGKKNLSFQIMDGEYPNFDQKFDLIVSNLSIQWFEKPLVGLQNLCQFLNPNGTLFYTTLGTHGFKEWKETLKQLNLSSGIIGSPDYAGIFQEDKKIITYDNALDFLRNFKKIGAHQPRPDYTPLNASQLKTACKAHDIQHHGKITWHILYGALNALGRPLHGGEDNIKPRNNTEIGTI